MFTSEEQVSVYPPPPRGNRQQTVSAQTFSTSCTPLASQRTLLLPTNKPSTVRYVGMCWYVSLHGLGYLSTVIRPFGLTAFTFGLCSYCANGSHFKDG